MGIVLQLFYSRPSRRGFAIVRLRPLYLLAALVVWLLSCGADVTLGQNAEPTSPTVAQPPSPDMDGAPAEAPKNSKPSGKDTPEAGPPDTYWMRDSKGNLVPVVGIPFEEFEQLQKLKRGLGPPVPPAYSLDSLAITGNVENNLANLQVAASIRVRETGWVPVPLRFNKSVLRQATTYEGPGEHFLRYEEQDGYVCWLAGAGDKPHVVKLNLTIPVNSLGVQSRIETVLPRATESTLKLVVPLAKAEAELRGAGEGLATTAQAGGGKTEIQVLGAGGELSLLWQPAQGTAAAARATLEAAGEINVKVEGRDRVTSEARLTVRRPGAPLESFRVRLPPGMEHVPTNPTGYSVTPVEPMPGSADEKTAGRVLEIKLDRPATGAAEVRLLAATAAAGTAGETGPKGGLEPAAFEVLSATVQRGSIEFTVDGDWSLAWTQDPGTRRVEVPAASATTKGSVARFEYFRQPCGLKVAIEPRPTRIAVEPTYVVYVEPKVVRLEATLKYRVRGARAQSLAISLGDWIYAKVGPETIVEVESLDPTAQKLVLPLRSGAVAGEFEIRLAAHKLLPDGITDLTFTLPRPMADIVTPASLIIVPADNVELAPKAREISGLVADSQPPLLSLPPRQQTPLAYRDLGVGGEAKFVGQSRIRTRQTTVTAAAKVQFGERAAQIDQRLTYRILYESQRTFTLQVPRSLLARGDLKVMLGSEVLPLFPLPESDGESSRIARVQVTAPDDQIGTCVLAVQYSLPVPSITAGQTTALALPLVIPDEEVDQVALGQTVSASWSDAMQVELAPVSRPGEVGPLVETTSRSELRATTSALSSEWRFQLRTSDPARSSRLAVSKMWVQTILLGSQRQERAVWRLSTGSSALRIQLPPRAEIQDDVAIDGRRVSARREEDVLVVPVVPSAEELVVEVWYSVPQQASGLAASLAGLTPPILEGAGQTRQCYWQICLPGREHVLLEPAGFTPELAWTWRGLFWDRLGTLDQASLERWIGASEQTALPAEMNTYLFSVFRSPPSINVLVLPRSAILWTIGGVVLLLGLTLLNVRAMRRPSVLLALGVVLAAAGLSWPASALLLAQVAAVALLVVLLSALWQWSLTGRTPYPVPVAPPEPKSTATSPRPEPIPATTATAPMSLAGISEPQP
jgi:hypothetical protein